MIIQPNVWKIDPAGDPSQWKKNTAGVLWVPTIMRHEVEADLNADIKKMWPGIANSPAFKPGPWFNPGLHLKIDPVVPAPSSPFCQHLGSFGEYPLPRIRRVPETVNDAFALALATAPLTKKGGSK